jgi:undecaprenyl diphosphate synthase
MGIWSKWFGKRKSAVPDRNNLPSHVAIIMDGNGRWASRKGLPRVAGHRSGMKNVKNIAIAANELGIETLTLYAFSTENWKRPKDEVDYLMSLPQEFYAMEIDELVSNNIRIRMMGGASDLPLHTWKPVSDAIERTRHNTGMILNFALNYGSRSEILEGVRRLMEEAAAGRVSPESLDAAMFEQYLQSAGLPDPDLLIRTSGELRLSNFMLWQLAYTELWFTDVYWPDFQREHFYEALRDYQCRRRRYGGL